jgi:uncharacterized membrane protein
VSSGWKIGAVLFGGVAILLLGLSVLVTAAVSAGAPPQLRSLFRPFCHGMPERCFRLEGIPMPICARCTGIYAGFLMGVFLMFAVRKLQRMRLPAWLALALVAPLFIDGVTQGIGLRESTNELRVVTGLLAGMALVGWVLMRFGGQTSPAETVETADVFSGPLT